MSESLESAVQRHCRDGAHEQTCLLNVLRSIQAQYGCVSGEAMGLIARELSLHRVEVEGAVSFYSFLSQSPKGRIVIRVCNDIIDRLHGADRIEAAFREELGIATGETTPDGLFTLETTACIGMCDQAPAALVNDVVVTEMSSDQAREIVRELRKHMDPMRLVHKFGDGNNEHPLVRSMVHNNLHAIVPVIFSPSSRGEAIRKAIAMSPVEVIRAVKTARLRGRGGAGFPTGMKWEFTRGASGDDKVVICNADEGEPGTFKDRVILTEQADRVFAGMTIAAYAIGASEGILYLRSEYAYLRPYLDHVLAQRRVDDLLGTDIQGRRGFDFDIRIQMGAGAYVCGEETALISSCEGRRGDPKNRPPFPAQEGYLGRPTTVNNVETLCCVTKILEQGPATFAENGTSQSSGTKLLSISGDCRRPGVYEVPFGISLRRVLEIAGGEDAAAVQIGGPSGKMIAPCGFDRTICYDDLATGGSIMVFNESRDVLEVVHAFMEFFEDESCGYCTPCRVGNVLLRQGIERIREGRGEPADLAQFAELGAVMKATSRCGLGQTSANPVLSTLENFRPAYEALVREDPEGFKRSFDLKAEVEEAERITGRSSTVCAEEG